MTTKHFVEFYSLTIHHKEASILKLVLIAISFIIGLMFSCQVYACDLLNGADSERAGHLLNKEFQEFCEQVEMFNDNSLPGVVFKKKKKKKGDTPLMPVGPGHILVKISQYDTTFTSLEGTNLADVAKTYAKTVNRIAEPRKTFRSTDDLFVPSKIEKSMFNKRAMKNQQAIFQQVFHGKKFGDDKELVIILAPEDWMN